MQFHLRSELTMDGTVNVEYNEKKTRSNDVFTSRKTNDLKCAKTYIEITLKVLFCLHFLTPFYELIAKWERAIYYPY